jgi:hypothetical protein
MDSHVFTWIHLDSRFPREVGMKFRKSIIKTLLCLVLMFFVGFAAFGDTIKLKDGTVLKGKVVSYGQGKFTIIVYIGGTPSRYVLSVDEVDSVEFDPSTDLATASGGIAASPGTTTPAVDSSANSRAADSGAAAAPAAAPAPANDLPPTAAGGLLAAATEKSVDVAAAADWVSTGIRVQRGQRIAIESTGEIGLGNNKRSGPDGLNLSDPRKLIPNRPTGALIAVVGDDNDDFVYIGSNGEFVATHNGVLFLSINEGNLKDNSGAFSARIKVMSVK